MRKDYTGYHSQHGEDRLLTSGIVDVIDSRILAFPVSGLPDDGVFVDVGASLPVIGNNTFHFEKNGWTGVCIEADERCIPRLLEMRKCPVVHCAIVKEPQMVTFNLCENQGLSSLRNDPKSPIVKSITVPGRTLEDVLQEHKIGMIDLLSIDTEGTELDVWGSFNWELHKPRVVIIEWYTDGMPSKTDEIVELLTKKFPYRLAAVAGGNLIFSL